MDFYKRLNDLIQQKGISQGKLEKELGLGNGAVSKWTNRLPKGETIILLAKYFNVSVDYLMTGKEVEFIVETAKKDVLLTKMPSKIKEYALKLTELPKEKQVQTMSLIDMLADKKEE